MPEVVDDLERTVSLPAPARRVVSLVPSETHSVAALAGVGVLAGRTRFCVEPAGELDAVPVVGGTKDVDVDAVLALSPDLVLANQEENARPAVEALIGAGAPVHVSFPKSVPESLRYLRSLATLLGRDADRSEVVRAAEAAFARRQEQYPAHPLATFVPIWMDPLMSFDGRAFASDVLEACGARNVCSDRPRRYPLAADLGRRAPLDPRRVGDRDTRYPRLDVDEVVSRAPDAVLLPDEPFAFTDAHATWFRALPIPAASARVALVSGKDLFWYGAWVAHGLDRIAAIVSKLAGYEPPPEG